VSDQNLGTLHHEERRFPPSEEFARQANARPGIREEAAADPVAFWEEQARRLSWSEPWTAALEWDEPFAKWFVGAKLNVSYNCVDRHVEDGLGQRVAFHWEGEPGDTRTVTYAGLQKLVAQAAHALTSLGVEAGTTVAIYMPMLPETVVAMLACARIGAPHTVVFGGFSAGALAERIVDCDARLVITADGGYRRGSPSALKPAVDEALLECPNVANVLVVRRTGQEVDWNDERDVWWHDLVPAQPETHEPQAFDAEHPLYIMYTSGTTARPKGILHTSGGYLTHTSATHRLVFDIKPETDVYWTAADIGWVTGHSYIVYGPLANAATSVMYEGTPDTPSRDRWWQLVDKYKVTVLYTAPTTIRTFMKWGEDLPAGHDLSSLRLLGSVGEPINPEAWIWYRTHIGGDRCPIVDTWWQTETGGIMICPLPGIDQAKPGAAMTPFPGIEADVVRADGTSTGPDELGQLIVRRPWPGMLRGIWGDDQRFKDTYWSKFPGVYLAGDQAKRDADGHIWVLGRSDDVMNVSGHRISTTEVEHALVDHPAVAEAAVVGASDPTTGQGIVAFVTVKGSAEGSDDLVADLRNHVAKLIGPIAKPRQIMLTPELPKTRSGKIMRRLLRDVAEQRDLGDVTTLLDPTVVNAIRQRMVPGAEENEQG
jgi:acetyl-CoA synthetase